MSLSYGPVVADHVSNPRNLGKLDHAAGVGQVDDASSETLLTLYLKLEDRPDGQRVVAEARFRALGCSGCIATGSIATELAVGLTADEIEAVDGAAISRALADGLPAEQRYCAD